MSNEQETHICKWCKAETWQSDDECYANPKNKQMTNNKHQTALEWFLDQLIEHRIIIVDKTTYQVKYKHEILLEQAKEIEKDQMEAAIIKQCAEQSTSEASKYAEGYTEGYQRALDYMSDAIKEKIEIKENDRNNFARGTANTTHTTFLCTQFIAEDRITTSLPNCIRCGKPQYQHPIITNTQ